MMYLARVHAAGGPAHTLLHLLTLPSLLLLLLCPLVSHAWEAGQTSPIFKAPAFKATAKVDTSTRCPQLRIALVNGVSFHFEILSGLLYLLTPYNKHLDVYLGPYTRSQNYDGVWDLIRWSKASFKRTTDNLQAKGLSYDLVILVSPDYELEVNEKLVRQMKPKLLLCIVHNSDYAQMDRLLALSRNLELLTLSPHVAKSLTLATKRDADWMLAVYPFHPETGCAAPGQAQGLSRQQLLGMCIRGFALQGKFSNLRRNYTALWQQIARHSEELRDPQLAKMFHLNVLGKGPNRLGLASELEAHVTVHQRLAFKQFYNIISHNVALVPSLANPK